MPAGTPITTGKATYYFPPLRAIERNQTPIDPQFPYEHKLRKLNY